jgi:hypothetical protein
MDEWQTNDCRDINWSVNFEVTVNGMEVSFDELTDTEKEIILNCIKEDSYSGTF